MTLEATAPEVPPPAPRGKRAKRSANTPEPTVTSAAAAPAPAPQAPEPREPEPEDEPMGAEGNPEVNRRLAELAGIDSGEGEDVQQAPRRRPAPTDFNTEQSFVGEGDPGALNPFTRSPMEPTESRKEQREQRREDRQSTQTPTPSTKRFGAIGKKMPGAERIRVHKRLDNGKLAFVGDYDSADLAASDNVESFIFDSITPKWGYGRYQIQGVDVHGRTFDAGRVEILAPLSEQQPPPAPAAPNPFDLLQQVMEREASRRDQEVQMLQRNQRDPIDMIKQLHELQQQMAPPMPPMPALKPSSDGRDNPTTVMLTGMMSMMTTVLASALQPKPEREDHMMPLLIALINNMNNKPVVDPTTQLTALSEVVKNLRGNDGGSSSSSQMIELLLKERMTPTDVLQMVDKFRGERGTDDFKKSLENMGFLLNSVQQVRALTEPSAGGGFMDVIGAALNNPALGEILSSRMRGGGQQPQQPQQRQLPPPQQQQPMRALPDPTIAAKARELALRELRLKELELEQREKALAAGGTVITTEAPAASSVAPPAAEVGEVGVETPAPAAAESSLPPNIADHVNAFLGAKTDEEIAQATLNFIFDMATDAKWKPYSETMLTLLTHSDRGRFLQYMASLFSSLKTIQLVNDELARRIMTSLHDNFEPLVQYARDSLQKLIEQQAAAAAAGESAESADEEGEDDEEGDDDEDEDDEEDPDDLLKLD